MDDAVIAFLVFWLICVSILALVAVVRAGSVKKSLNSRIDEQQEKIRSLEWQAYGLRQQLAQQQGAASAARPVEKASVAPAQQVAPVQRVVPPAPTPAPTYAPPVPAPVVPAAAAPVRQAPPVQPQVPVTPQPVVPAAQSSVNVTPRPPQYQAPTAPVAPQPPVAPAPIPAPAPVVPVAATPVRQVPPVPVPTPAPIPVAPVAAAPMSSTPSPVQQPVPAQQQPLPVPPQPAPPQHQAIPQMPQRPAYAPTSTPMPVSTYAPTPGPVQPPQPKEKTIGEKLRTSLPLEELLGMNLFAKLGIALLVLGFALLGRVALISMGAGPRVAMITAIGAGLLGGGIFLERKERYKLVGRTLIGGGWALLFFTAYAVNHVAAMMVLASNTLDCVLMLAVATGMVVHTLRYKSQLVTGMAFLLAFSTIAMSQDTVYSLVAGVILAVGIAVIALRMNWFKLEIFGILASYGNHFYWLYKQFPDGVAGHAFPYFAQSACILAFYWAIYRFSYVVRKIEVASDERLSTVAALLNTILLLVVMKFQSMHPELAFYALLALGAMEFLLGQLPITKKRRPAFVLLSVIGTILIFTAVPFRFSGNNIALLWMIAAEVLLIAGITQAEVIFRRLGLLGGIFTGALVLYEMRNFVVFRMYSDAVLVQSGVLLLLCSALFYINAHYVRTRWANLFAGVEEKLATCQSYLGLLTALLGISAVCTKDWTAVGWAALMLPMVWGKKKLDDRHLLAQGYMLAVVVLIRALIVNCHFASPYPAHITGRLITLPLLAVIFYGVSWILTGAKGGAEPLRHASLWVGSASLVALMGMEIRPSWVGVAWIGFAIALSLLGRRLKLADLNYQEHVLAFYAVGMILSNINAANKWETYISLVGCAVGLYAISRFCTIGDAVYKRYAAWAHTWVATGLLTVLAWYEAPALWVAAIWAVFALLLLLADRKFDLEELPYQSHALALLAVLRVVTLNLYSTEKWHSVDIRLITVLVVAVTLYALARWVRMPAVAEAKGLRHAYSWIAAALVSCLLWYELQPISVALGLAVFGLLLFEVGQRFAEKQLRWQAYALLAASFVRIFFANLTSQALQGEVIGPRIYILAPIVLIYFFVWWQLQPKKEDAQVGGISWVDLIAYFGTTIIAVLLYFQFQASPEWVVLAWAVVVLVLLVASLLLDKEVFLHQAELLVAVITVRGLTHNIFGGSHFVNKSWHGNFYVLPFTCAVLMAALPVALRLYARYKERPAAGKLVRYLALRRPEQILFFASVVLLTLMIAVKMNAGVLTLLWGVEGFIAIALGLIVSQRSYRLTGLGLLLLCVAKIIFHDAWLLGDRDRYLTFIVLGAALTAVSMLYGKYRDVVRRLL